jgi:hypothetical protein
MTAARACALRWSAVSFSMRARPPIGAIFRKCRFDTSRFFSASDLNGLYRRDDFTPRQFRSDSRSRVGVDFNDELETQSFKDERHRKRPHPLYWLGSEDFC